MNEWQRRTRVALDAGGHVESVGKKLVRATKGPLLWLAFVAYSFCAFAAAPPYEPTEFRPPAWLVGIREAVSSMHESRGADPPDAIASRPRPRFSGVSESEALDGGAQTEALISGLPLDVGRIAGTPSVTATGTATYTIPLWLPPGARGIQPELSIVYASGSADDLLGPGWSLEGLSAISRCNKTWTQDGTPEAVSLSSTDKFCLDGNRLRLTGGTYGAAGSTYQTELETFSRVTAYGSAGNGPSYFTVEGKDGRYYDYGGTPDSKAYASGSSTPYAWLLNSVRDRQGNNLIVAYSTTSGAIRPASMSYTQTPATGATYPYTVIFSYQPRVTNLSVWVAGVQIQQTQVLGQIDVQHLGSSIRTYNFGYATAPTTQRDRLIAIQECTLTSCLPVTNVTYQDGVYGIPNPSTSSGSGATRSGTQNTADFNGDGLMDLVFATQGEGTDHIWHVQFASSGGYGAPINTGAVTTADNVVFDDFLAEGRDQILAPISGTWTLFRWNGSAFSATSAAPVDPLMVTGPGAMPAASADTDGDGLPDLTWIASSTVFIRRNTTVNGTISFAPAASQAFQWAQGTPNQIRGNNGYANSSVRQFDWDGDGREDVVFSSRGEPMGGGLPPTSQRLYSRGSTFTSGGVFSGENTVNLVPVNWNSDGCTDLARAVGTGGGPAYVHLAKCDGSETFVTIPLPNGSSSRTVAVDWDSDGRTDILQDSGGTWQLLRSLDTAVATPVPTGIPVGASNWIVTDKDGDGQGDLGFPDPAASYAIRYSVHNGVNTPPDLATSIVDGFGMSASFSYYSIAATGACYYRDSGPPQFPNRVFIGPVYTACSLTASNGSGGTYQISLSYYNANIHLQGRGFLGFERRYSIDNRDGIVHMESYAQSFPYIGMVTYSLARQPNWTTKIHEISNTLDQLTFGDRAHPYVRESTEDTFEVDGTFNGQWITRSTQTVSLDSYGNPTTTTVSLADQMTASPFYGETYTEQTVQTIFNDTANWCLGHPHQTTVQSTMPDATSQTRTVSAAVDYVNCRNTQEIIEPSSSTLRVSTTYEYLPSGCGHVTSVSTIGKNPNGTDMPSRAVSSTFGTRCQFPETVTNPLGQITTTAYNYNYGKPSSQTDPNQLTVSWQYDGYGRKTRETRPDGTITIWSFTTCDVSNGYCGVPDLRWYTTEDEYSNVGELIRYKRFFHDGLNRLRYDGRKNLAGGQTWHVIIGYDARGNEWYRYNPYETSNNGYTSFTYDLINRPTVSALYNSSGAWDRQSLIAYAGRAVTFTDPKGNVSAKYYDVRGQLRRVVDPAPGGTTAYGYDPFGNLTVTIDPVSAGSTATFNLRGFKTASYDPDAGSWTYAPNSLGEIVSQTDAKLQTVTFSYDLLGRTISRDEPEGVSTWTWGTSAAAKNIGKLSAISGPGYSESYVYDPLGRAVSTTFNADTAYQVDYTYHPTTGYLETVSYPTSTNGCRFKAQHGYLNGILRQVTDASPSPQCGPSGTVLWLKNAEDARGQPTEEILGNEVRVTSDFDGLTGLLITRKSGNNASYNNHQHLAFAWDKGDNLTERSDLLQSGSGCIAGGLCEKFYYDALDRLDNSTLNGAQNLDVTLDAAGNITYKLDVGTYAYHPIKRHAVETTTNGWSFSYDANGNMLTGRGATITWTSYNKPSSITNGGIYSQFTYTPNRQYWRQTAQHSTGSETTIYIGGLLEKVTATGGYTEYRHMVPVGSTTVVVARSTSGINQTLYVARDHLDSSSVTTNQLGTVVARSSFGAYGERRSNSGWSGTLTTTEWNEIASTTRRGFTGHTMLDNLALVHMNGRIYDPIIGRFLSPDPIIQTFELSQALNPYSYVMNNPLKYIDPSGYSWLSKAWKKVKRFFKKWGGTIISIAFAVAGFPFVGSLFGSAFSTVANHGNFGRFLQGFAIGAIAGAIAGPIGSRLSGALGIGGSTLGAHVVQGALTGGIAGGIASSLTGGSFWSGFTSGAITGGLSAGLVARYGVAAENTALGKTLRFAEQEFRSSVADTPRWLADIVGKVWGLPNTLVGLTYGGLGHVVGWMMGTNPGVSIGNNAIQFTNNPLMSTAMTFGNVVVYGTNAKPGEPGVGGHTLAFEERQHTIQSQVLGPLYFPAHLVFGTVAFLSHPSWGLVGGWHSRPNLLERGPHSIPPRPWGW